MTVVNMHFFLFLEIHDMVFLMLANVKFYSRGGEACV